MSNLKTQHPLMLIAVFTVLTYGLSYACWWPILGQIKPNLMEMSPSAIALMMAGGFGPSAAALILTFIIGGPHASGALLSRIGRWKVPGKWYLIAVLFAPVVTLGGVGIYAALGYEVGAIRWDHWWVIAAFYAVTIFMGPLLEETGWRGFAQPVLFGRFGIFVTGVIIGTIWTFWHAPLWFAGEGSSLSGDGLSAQSLVCYWLFLVGQSVILAWILPKARGSVLLAMLMHQGVNAGAIGWLFYNIADAHKPWVFEQLPVLVVWAIIGLGLLFGAFRGRAIPEVANM